MSFQLSLSADAVSAAYPEEPLLVSPESTVGEVLQLLRAQSSNVALICDEASSSSHEAGPHQTPSTVAGIFTERDALRCMAAGTPAESRITEVMTANPTTVSSESSVGEVVEKMSRGGYRNLPILSADGVPQGVAAVKGLVHYLVEHFPSTIYNLPPQPGRSPSEREGA